MKIRPPSIDCQAWSRIQVDENTLKLLMVGPHENFYRDLKRTEH